MSLQQVAFACPPFLPPAFHLRPVTAGLRRRRPWADEVSGAGVGAGALAPRPRQSSSALEHPGGDLGAVPPYSRRGDEDGEKGGGKVEGPQQLLQQEKKKDNDDDSSGDRPTTSNQNASSSFSDMKRKKGKRQQPKPFPGRAMPPPPPRAIATRLLPAQSVFGGHGGSGGDGGGGVRRLGSGRISREIEDMRASIEDLLGTQQLGSGSWKEPGAAGDPVPAAVEREQRTLVREIKAMSRRARWKEVLEVVERARFQGTPLNGIIYRCAISAVGRCGRWKEALALLDQMQVEDIEYDEYTYNAAIAACSVANNWQKAIELFRAMDRGEIRGARGERSGPGGGRQGIRGRTPRAGTVSYNAAITAYSRALQPKEALALLEEMKDRGVPRDEISYNAAIDACAKGGLWETALGLLSEMDVAGAGVAVEAVVEAGQQEFRPSLVSYNSALDACARAGRWEEATDLLDKMRGEGVYGEDMDLDYSLLDDAMMMMVTGEAQGQEEEAQATEQRDPTTTSSPSSMAAAVAAASATRPPAPDTFSYNACIVACRRGGQQGIARLLLMEMMSRDLRPNGKTVSAMLTERGAVVGSNGEEERGRERRVIAALDATTVVVQRSRCSPRWKQVLLVLDAVACESLGPDPSCVNVALMECAKAGRWEESRRLLADLRKACRPSIHGNRFMTAHVMPDITKYNMVLNLLRNAPPPADDTAGTMEDEEKKRPLQQQDQQQQQGSNAKATTSINGLGVLASPAHERSTGGSASTAYEQKTRSSSENVLVESRDSHHFDYDDGSDDDGGGDGANNAMTVRLRVGGGAEGWRSGQVAAFLDDMREAGVRPDDETYRCAVRCATDAAVADSAEIAAAPAAAAAEPSGGSGT